MEVTLSMSVASYSEIEITSFQKESGAIACKVNEFEITGL